MVKSMSFRSTLAAVAWAISFSVYAMATAPTQMDIPAGNLVPALEALKKQAAIELVFQPEQLRSFHTKGAKGAYEPKQAVLLLLKGTPFEVRTGSSGAIVIAPSHSPVSRAETQSQAAGVSSTGDDSRGSLQLTQATSGQAADAASVESEQKQNEASKTSLQEVIVTAQKKTENLLDVPVPVTVVNVQSLVDTNQLSLQDYYTSIPALSLAPGDFHASPMLAIRGITTGAGFTNPTVGITVDDVPFGLSTSSTGSYLPDFDPSDLARIEVLRGPQGTLYGANSMGGLVKYVTVDPSMNGLSGIVQAGTDSVQNGAQVGYSLRGALNLPITDALAVRGSGFTHQDPGYVDSPLLGLKGVNEEHAEGGHIAGLWKPAENFSLKLSALVQRDSSDGSSYVAQSGLGDWQQNFLRGTGPSDTTYQSYSAILKWRVRSVNLTVLSAYNVDSFHDSFDLTPFFGPVNQAIFGVSGSPLLDHSQTEKLSEEVRLEGSLWRNVDWLLGGFYTRERWDYGNHIFAENPATGEIVAQTQDYDAKGRYEEDAVFADVTYRFTDRIDVQFGGRESKIRQFVGAGFYQGPTGSPFISSPIEVPQENFFTYLLTPRLRITPDLMVYARLASGYRPGGGVKPQPGELCVVENFPCQYNPDSTHNYEIGVKGAALEHKLSFDASLYYIEWRDIQLQLFNSVGTGFTSNAGQAKSEGIELSVESKPLSALTVSAWIAWDDAVLTQAIPSNSTAVGADGARLPYSSRYSGNLSLNQDFRIDPNWTGFVGGAVTYVGDREGLFATTSDSRRQQYPAYTKTDLRGGVRYKTWTASVYVNNVGNVRGLVGGGAQTFNPTSFLYIQPRTIGLTVSTAF
jgi:iron complex outermembrane receptor protein